MRKTYQTMTHNLLGELSDIHGNYPNYGFWPWHIIQYSIYKVSNNY